MTTTAEASLLRDALATLGYGPELVVELAAGDVRGLLAYTSAQMRDLGTTAVAAWIGSEDAVVTGALEAARRLAVPVGLGVDGDRYLLYSIGSSRSEDRSVIEIDGREGLRRFSADLGPYSLGRAKRSEFQLSLFPLDVKLLSTQRHRAMEQLEDRVHDSFGRLQQRDGARTAIKEVIASLAIAVVRDRYQLNGASAQEIVDNAVLQMDANFVWMADLVSHLPSLDAALETISSGLDFSHLDAEVLGQLYEKLLLEEATRNQLGIFYTPLDFARRIMAVVPLQEIPPENRFLLDPSCGAGNLLVAAHERLQDLAPSALTELGRHEMLRASIHGADVDEVATEIARLSLVIHSLPFGNDWRIDVEDALASTSDEQVAAVVSNPPWSDDETRGGKQAERFLDQMMHRVAPDGFLTCVLPGSWQSSKSAGASRERLREDFDVFEMWRLPRDVFPSARYPSCVLFAQRRKTGRPWLYRQVAPTKRNIASFLSDARTSYSAIEEAQEARAPMLASPFEDLVECRRTIRDVAQIISGVVARTGAYDIGTTPVVSRSQPIEALGALEDAALTFVGDMSTVWYGPRNLEPLLQPKVLMRAVWSPDAFWRCRPVLDLKGAVPTDVWHAAVPKRSGKAPIYALHALFASSFASGWLFFHATGRRLPVTLFKQMPIPDEWEAAQRELASFGRRIAASRDDARSLEELDDFVLDLYRAPKSLRSAIRAFAGETEAPEGRNRYANATIEKSSLEVAPSTRSAGVVLEVERSALVLWTDGLEDESVRIGLPDHFPGWLCQEGAEFEVRTDGEPTVLDEYSGHRMAWLPDAVLEGRS